MAAPATNDLVEEAKCYMCFGPVTQAQLLELALERRILLGVSASADTSAQALLDYSKCFACYGLSLFDMMELALLDQIAQA